MTHSYSELLVIAATMIAEYKQAKATGLPSPIDTNTVSDADRFLKIRKVLERLFEVIRIKSTTDSRLSVLLRAKAIHEQHIFNYLFEPTGTADQKYLYTAALKTIPQIDSKIQSLQFAQCMSGADSSIEAGKAVSRQSRELELKIAKKVKPFLAKLVLSAAQTHYSLAEVIWQKIRKEIEDESQLLGTYSAVLTTKKTIKKSNRGMHLKHSLSMSTALSALFDSGLAALQVPTSTTYAATVTQIDWQETSETIEDAIRAHQSSKLLFKSKPCQLQEHTQTITTIMKYYAEARQSLEESASQLNTALLQYNKAIERPEFTAEMFADKPGALAYFNAIAQTDPEADIQPEPALPLIRNLTLSTSRAAQYSKV